MDHNAYTFLVGPDGGAIAIYSHGIHPDDMARSIRRFIRDPQS